MLAFGIMLSPDNVPGVVCSIFTAAILVGKYSGAHFNGALTLAIYILEAKWKKFYKLVIVYFFAELLGAYIGILFAYSITGYGNIGFLAPGPYGGLFVAYVEAIGTFVILTMILYVKYNQIAPTYDGVLKNVAAIITIYCYINIGKPYSGSGYNITFATA